MHGLHDVSADSGSGMLVVFGLVPHGTILRGCVRVRAKRPAIFVHKDIASASIHDEIDEVRCDRVLRQSGVMSVVTNITFTAQFLRIEKDPARLACMESAVAISGVNGTHMNRGPVRPDTKLKALRDYVVVVFPVRGVNKPLRSMSGIDARTLRADARTL